MYITKSPAPWTLNKESDIEAIFSEVGEIQQLDWGASAVELIVLGFGVKSFSL